MGKNLSTLRDYNQEAPINHLIARHWDTIEIKEVCQGLLSAIPQGNLMDYLVSDSLQREQVFAYFATFENQPLDYLHSEFHLFYQVAAPDDYTDLRGQLQLTFQAGETAYTVLLGMARLGDQAELRWLIYDILWQDQGVLVAAVPLIQLEEPDQEEVCVLVTDFGEIRLRLFPEQAPLAVENWRTLAKQGFYDGTPFARVIMDFVIQGGALDGSGDEAISSYEGFFADEVHRGLYHFNGALALGNHGPHTNGNQFFIVQNTKVKTNQLPKLSLPKNVKQAYLDLGGLPELDGRYTVFGQVYEGIDVVERIAAQATDAEDSPVHPVFIQKILFD
nr:peptidylprolyl isomerase [Enterococcus sp. 665A]